MGKDIDNLICDETADFSIGIPYPGKRKHESYWKIRKDKILFKITRYCKYKVHFSLKKGFDKNAAEIHKQFNKK